MSGLPDLFPGFETRTIETSGAEIFLRLGGSGPPLLLLHGYPQTHVCWHKVAGGLAAHYTLVIPDLRGYGASSCPETDPEHLTYSKRAMAADMVEVMSALGHERFRLVGHDRGGRVAYRLALDHGDRLERLAVLDIVPTLDVWQEHGPRDALGKFHWALLAQPAPLPETLIGADPDYWLEHLLKAWNGAGDLTPFDAGALEHYRTCFREPERIHTTCEDYRAGATCDPEMDAQDRAGGRRITCPTLAVWGQARDKGFVSKALDIWQDWCTDVRGGPIACGHFLAEERPQETLEALLPFLSES